MLNDRDEAGVFAVSERLEILQREMLNTQISIFNSHGFIASLRFYSRLSEKFHCRERRTQSMCRGDLPQGRYDARERKECSGANPKPQTLNSKLQSGF